MSKGPVKGPARGGRRMGGAGPACNSNMLKKLIICYKPACFRPSPYHRCGPLHNQKPLTFPADSIT